MDINTPISGSFIPVGGFVPFENWQTGSTPR